MATPVIESFSPRSATPGTAVTITGSGFGMGTPAAELKIGGSVVPISSINDTQIVFTVSGSTPSGRISIVVEGETASTTMLFLNMRTVVGQLQIPDGMTPDGYRVGRGLNPGPIDANGAFSSPVLRDVPEILTALRESDDPVFMAVAWPDTTNVTIDARSTAIALVLSSPLASLYDEELRDRLAFMAETAETAATISAASADGRSYLDDGRFQAAYQALLRKAMQPMSAKSVADGHPEFEVDAPGVRAFSIRRNEVTPTRLKPGVRTLPDSPGTWVIEMDKSDTHPNLLHVGLVFMRVNPATFPDGIGSIQRMDSQSQVGLLSAAPLSRGYLGANLRTDKKWTDFANIFGESISDFLDLAAASNNRLSPSGFLVPKNEPAVYEVRAYSGNVPYGVRHLLQPSLEQTVALGNLDRDNEWGDAKLTNIAIAAVDVASLWLGEVKAFSDSDLAGIILSVKAEVAKAVAAHIGERGDLDDVALWEITKAAAVGVAKAVGPMAIEPTWDELFVTKAGRAIGTMIKHLFDASGKAATFLQVVERMGNLIIPTHFAVERTIIVVGDPFAPSIDSFSPSVGSAGGTVHISGRGLPASPSSLVVSLCTFEATGIPPTISASLPVQIISGNAAGLTVRLPNAAEFASTFGPGHHDLYICIENTASGSKQTTRLNPVFNTFSYMAPPEIVSVNPSTLVPGQVFSIHPSHLRRGTALESLSASIDGNLMRCSAAGADGLTFTVPGFISPGIRSLTLVEWDPGTGQTLGSSAPVVVTIIDPWPVSEIGSSSGGYSISISKWDMSNSPDGHISVYEAFAIAKGTLGRPIEPHVDGEPPNTPREIDRISGLNTGSVSGRHSFSIAPGTDLSTPIVLTTPLPGMIDGWSVDFSGGIFDGSLLPDETPGLDLEGLEGVQVRGGVFRLFPGPAIHLGAGSRWNSVSSALVQFASETGVRVADGATFNKFHTIVVEDTGGDGIHITGEGTRGNVFSSSSSPPLFGGTMPATRILRAGGIGVRIDGGASDNKVDAFEVRDCESHGVAVLGAGTVRNAVGWVAGIQGIRHVAGNGGDGVLIGGGADGTLTWYLVAGGNAGDGYHVFDVREVVLRGPWTGIDRNPAPTGNPLIARRNQGHSIAFHGVRASVIGAPGRPVLGDDTCVGGSELGGILLDDAQGCILRGLKVGTFNSLFGDIEGPSWMPVGAGHAIHLRNGSSDNQIGDVTTLGGLEVRAARDGSGLLMEGPGTDRNRVLGSVFGSLSGAAGANPDEELAYGISIVNGAAGNVIGEVGVRRSLSFQEFFQPYNSLHYASLAAVRIEDVVADFNAAGEPVNPNRVVANRFGVTSFGGSSLEPYVGVLLKGRVRGQWIGGEGPGTGNQMGRVGYAGIHLDGVTADSYAERNRIGSNWINFGFNPGLTNTDPLVGPVRTQALLMTGGRNQVVGEGWTANNQFFAGEVGVFIEGGSGHVIRSARIDNHPVAGVVLRNATDCRLGGAQPTDRLQLTRNGGGGGPQASAVLITGGGYNEVTGSWIGDEGGGTAFWANPGDGVRIVNSAHNSIGGAHPQQGNIIARCGGDGIHVHGTGSHHNRIGNNVIGRDTLRAAAGNTGNGVRFTAGAHHNLVGGEQMQTLATRPIRIPAPNTITSNGRDGVLVEWGGADTAFNTILGNSIFANAGLGIVLTGGANHSQLPLATAVFDGGRVFGTVASLASTPAGSVVQVFSDDDIDEPEGETYLGQTRVRFDGTWTMPRPFIPAGRVLSATVTHSATGDTSSFTKVMGTGGSEATFGLRFDRTPNGAPAAILTPGGAGVAVMGLTVTTDNVDVVLTRLALQVGGTAELASLRFGVVHDVDRDGQVGPGDRILSSEATPAAGSVGLILDDVSLQADEVQRWLVVARATTAAPSGRTLDLTLETGADVLTRVVLPVGAPATPFGAFPIPSEVFTIGAEGQPPGIATNPISRAIAASGRVSFFVSAEGAGPFTYQWRRNGVDIAGATGATLELTDVQAAGAGAYSVVVSNPFGSTTSSAATLTVNTAARLINLSARAFAGAGDATLVLGFYIEGTGSKTLLIRGIGPKLLDFNVPSVVADPSIVIYKEQTPLDSNDDWDPALAADFPLVGAFELVPGSKDAALKITLPQGGYTVHLVNTGSPAEALIEVYDFSKDAGTRLVNLSCRLNISVGEIVIVGTSLINNPVPVVVRNAGPALGAHNVTGHATDTRLRVYAGQTEIAANEDWDETLEPDFAAVGAFTFTRGSKDAALRVQLTQGGITVHATVVDNDGIALVEIYEGK